MASLLLHEPAPCRSTDQIIVRALDLINNQCDMAPQKKMLKPVVQCIMTVRHHECGIIILETRPLFILCY